MAPSFERWQLRGALASKRLPDRTTTVPSWSYAGVTDSIAGVADSISRAGAR
ncbi:hypothetical protein [Streptomyces mirabilis]|uniref:hypothetical protein n=1 Tax=Streptomyces mirabilis TaxID=68239 RepID=UPI003656D403